MKNVFMLLMNVIGGTVIKLLFTEKEEQPLPRLIHNMFKKYQQYKQYQAMHGNQHDCIAERVLNKQ